MLLFLKREIDDMMRNLDWVAAEERAAAMTDEQLHFARVECFKTASVWDRYPDKDPDGNGGYYRDEGSVYVAEQKKRAEGRISKCT